MGTDETDGNRPKNGRNRAGKEFFTILLRVNPAGHPTPGGWGRPNSIRAMLLPLAGMTHPIQREQEAAGPVRPGAPIVRKTFLGQLSDFHK